MIMSTSGSVWTDSRIMRTRTLETFERSLRWTVTKNVSTDTQTEVVPSLTFKHRPLEQKMHDFNGLFVSYYLVTQFVKMQNSLSSVVVQISTRFNLILDRI